MAAGTFWNLSRSSGLEDAERASTLGDFETCLARALDHLDRNPWSQRAALLAARCLSRLDRVEQAEIYYRRAGKLDLPDLQLRAYAIARGPHPAQAVAAFKEILERSPNQVSAMRRLAAVELALSDRAALKELADRLDRAPEGQVLGATLRGVVHHNEKNHELACEDFLKVLKIDPELKEMPLPRAFFFGQLAEDLIASGRIDEAREQLLKAVAIRPEASLFNWIGHCYLLQGKLDEASDFFHKAVEADPTLHGAWVNLGKLELQRNRPEKALAALERARSITPNSYAVLYNLSVIYRRLGKPDQAEIVQNALRELRLDASSEQRSVEWPSYAL